MMQAIFNRKMSYCSSFILLVLAAIINVNSIANLCQSAAVVSSEITPIADLAHVEINRVLPASQSISSQAATQSGAKLKRDSRTKVTSLELDTQETGYLPSPHHHTTDSGYGYDSGKNSHGKKASDWSLYDHGNHGHHDNNADKAWYDQGHKAHSTHGNHDSYGNAYNSHNANHGSGYYSRDRGYGYEKRYAYDKELASKQHSDNHNSYGSSNGLRDYYGNSASSAHANNGHDKYGQASRYGNHGYGKRGSDLAAQHDYGHNANKGHHYSQSSHNPHGSYSHGYLSHLPSYKTTYSDHGSHIGYPDSYPSYY